MKRQLAERLAGAGEESGAKDFVEALMEMQMVGNHPHSQSSSNCKSELAERIDYEYA